MKGHRTTGTFEMKNGWGVWPLNEGKLGLDGPVAVFQFADQANEWAKKHYPENCVVYIIFE